MSARVVGIALLGEAELRRPEPRPLRLGDATLLGTIAFLVQHDACHRGQVAFLPRQLGRPAMSYVRAAPAAPA